MEYMATASTDRSVGLTNMKTRDTIYLQGHADCVYGCSFSPNSEQIASCSNDGTVIIWNSNDGEKSSQFKAHQLLARSVCWSPNGEYIATGSNDQSISVWSINRFTRRQQYNNLGGWVRDIEWHNNGLLAGVGNDPNLNIFDVRQKKGLVLQIPTQSKGDLSSLSFHYSGDCIAVGSFDRVVRIFDLRTGKLLQRHSAHTDAVTRVAFRPYSEDLLSVGRDHLARLWDLKAAKVSAVFDNHTDYALGCSWLPSARGFVTSGEDRRINAYRIKEGKVDPSSLEFDDGDILDALEKMQMEISNLADTMKALDKRLLLQEEKLQWLSDIDLPKTRNPK